MTQQKIVVMENTGYGTLGDVQAKLDGLHLSAWLFTSYPSLLEWELFRGLSTQRYILWGIEASVEELLQLQIGFQTLLLHSPF